MDMNSDNDFEAAFAAAVGIEPDAPVEQALPSDPAPVEASAEVETPVEPEVESAETEQAEVTTKAEALGDAANAFVDVATAASPVEQPAPVAPAQQQIDPKYLAMAIAEEQERRAQQAAAAQPPVEPKAPSYEDYLTPEQKAALATFDAEWADVAAPVQTLINAHVQAALAVQQQQILAQVQQQMAPIQQVTAQSQEALYWNTISAVHPDFREVAPALPEWIENQPFKVAQQYMAQYQSGNAADAVQLLSAYKQAMGSTGAAPAQPASSAVQATPKAAPVSKAALAATAAVPPAQRSKVVAARDPNDFESAFNEAIAR